MADPRFFRNAGPFALADLAGIAEAELSSGADGDRLFADVAPLDRAGAADVSFLDNRKYIDAVKLSAAGACVLHPKMATHAPSGMALLFTPTPYKAFALVARAFYPRQAAVPGVAAGAVVDPAAVVDPTAEIGAGAVVGGLAEIGARCRIGANAVIGEGVVVGEDSEIGANASISHCLIGCRVRVYPGARIGQEGFGFAIDPRGHVTVPQLGRVIVEDDVEIGANTCIDRGAGPDTVIGRGAMIDNLVQIGHNVQIGPGSVLAAQSGIAGSTRLGKFVALGGQAGVAGHLTLGDGSRAGAQSGVIRDLPASTDVWGTPAIPNRQFWRRYAKLTRLSGLKGE